MKAISVLFVDDEENILHALKRMFANEAYGVATASSAEEGMAIIARGGIKVVLSDQRMPYVSGVEFLRQVKELCPDTVRILFTAYADLSAAERAINISEVFRLINKPWEAVELKVAVEGAIRHYDLLVENRRLYEETKIRNEELESANRKLKALYEIQKEFSSTLSHELRTPLASIKAGVDIVLSGTTGDLTADQKDFLSKSKANIDRLNRLINDILDLAHLESGKTPVNIQPNDLNGVVRSVMETQGSVAQDKGVYLKSTLDPQLPAIAFDVDKIIQVLNNLIANAIKFTDKGGVTVSTFNHPQANHIEICIKDTGYGIQAEDIPKLFNKFQQLGEPAHRKTGGTGLGLAICKEIIRQHGGKIYVESKAGEGSAFYFVLPIQERRVA